jgi:hypothetical protein
MKKVLTLSAAMLFFSAISVSAALLEGTVAKVDKSKKQILLQTDKGPETVEFTGSTRGADKVKAGDRVKVSYTEKSGKIVADTIDASKGSPVPSPGERSTAPNGMKNSPPAGLR